MSTIEEIDALNQQAWESRNTQIREALALCERARDLAAEVGYQAGLAQSALILGHCTYRLGEYVTARAQALLACDLFEQLGNHEGQADALNIVGNVLAGLGDYHKAVDYYLQSLAIRNAIGLRQAEAASLNNIGNVYFHLNDYANALESHMQSLAIKTEIDDRPGIATSLHNIGNIYRETKDYRGALHHYRQSLAMFQDIGQTYGEAGSLSELGHIYTQLGDLPQALDCHQRSLAIEQRIGNRLGEAESLLYLGELALQQRSPAELRVQAFDYLQRALQLAHDLGAKELIYRVSLALSQAYQAAGDFEAALKHYQVFSTTQREVFDQELSERTKKLQIIHQVETSQRELAQRMAEAEALQAKNTELAAALAEARYHQGVAEQANLLKSEMLSIAAHDLKNPLGAIVGYAQLLQLQGPDDWEGNEIVDRICNVAEQMLHVIVNLLKSATIDSNDFQLHFELVDLGILAALAVEQNRQQADRKQQQIFLRADPDCIAQADEWRMREVFDNLLSNAIKFSLPEQSIWVEVVRQGAHIHIIVKDQGQGLTLQDQQRLFSKFARLSAQPTGVERSSGLGLSIVRRLVELHNGRVWAESAGPGTGSTFTVELPVPSTAA